MREGATVYASCPVPGAAPGLHPHIMGPHVMSRRRFSSTGSGSCGDSSSSGSSSTSSSSSDPDYMSAAQLHASLTKTASAVASVSEESEGPVTPVTEQERQQVGAFFRSLKTQVFVCGALTNLYVGSAGASWELRLTGIPVVLLDSGETRARSKRRIQIVLAERGSCFTLWQDTIDNLSSYRLAGPAFHTMCLSSDHSTRVGLSFDCPQAAQELWEHIERLTSCPENISLSGPCATSRKGKSPKPKKPAPLPSKAHISQPCCFTHVTSVESADRGRYFSLQTLLPSSATVAVVAAAADQEKAVPSIS